MNIAKLGKNVEALDRDIITDILINPELYKMGLMLGVGEYSLEAVLDAEGRSDNARDRFGYGDILIFKEWGPKDGASFMKLSELLVKMCKQFLAV